jgi:hypothetical protein
MDSPPIDGATAIAPLWDSGQRNASGAGVFKLFRPDSHGNENSTRFLLTLGQSPGRYPILIWADSASNLNRK